MKLLRKASVAALAAALALSCTACNSEESSGGTSSGTQGGNAAVANTELTSKYTTYNNRAYNEYLVGDETTIKNQWEGYGIGDPFIMRYNGEYYLYVSTLNDTVGVRAYKSTDLVNWTPITGEGLTEGYVSEDVVTVGAYAPEVYYFNGKFYMYTSPAGNGHYILVSDKPEGPFVAATDNFGLSIDGSVLIDNDETMYFTYASTEGIHIAKMTDMLTVDTTATPLLNNTSIGGWTEGPYILYRDGYYYLTYTGNHVNSDGYRIAYATGTSMSNDNGGINRGAFTRATLNPLILETETALKGLGHSSTVMGPDLDSYYIAYHMLNSSGGPNRSLGIDRLLFNGNQMSVAPTLDGSITPASPVFYAMDKDSEKFDVTDALVISKDTAKANFSAEFNTTGSAVTTYVFGYADDSNYSSVTVDLAAKKITLSKTTGGTTETVAEGTLINDFSADVLHTIRVAAREGKVNVTFDNMTKIENAEMTVEAGKIGYKDLPSEAVVGCTVFSNVAMGMSDELEAKQYDAYIGASLYANDSDFGVTSNLTSSAVATLDDGDIFDGTKAMTLSAEKDYASYIVNFREAGRYGIELVYPVAYGGKKIGIRLNDGTTYRCTLPAVDTYETYAKAIVAEFDVAQGANVVSLENVGEEVKYVCFQFVETAAVTPQFEHALDSYVETGVDYKTIWKIKDGGHYAKAGTRQLLCFGDNTITDFTLDVEVKFEGSTGTSTAGIVFHAQNYAASSYDSNTSLQGYYLSVNNNQVVLDRLNYADGTVSGLGTFVQNNPFATSDEYIPLRIQVRGNNIKAWSGDTLLIDVTDAMGFSNGKTGLYTNGAAVMFRNLKISE